MTGTLKLPLGEELERYMISGSWSWPRAAPPPRSRSVFAAVHGVARASDPRAVDWEATIAVRERIWRLGLGVADAMDTAQRGAGLGWPLARELICRSADAARASGGALVSGVGTDQLRPGRRTLAEILSAYEEQLAVAQEAGSRVVLMASAALAAAARSSEDYLAIYSHLIGTCEQPVIIHWLGAMFDPALAGYWGADNLDSACQTVLALVAAHPGRIEGIKLSLLDPERELALRSQLPCGVRLYTGDDLHYPELIEGDEGGHSDALLGALDPLAAPVRAALDALDDGDLDTYRHTMQRTLPVARTLFEQPTRHYKTGVVFLAWLAGQQDEFTMLGGHEGARGLSHLAELFRAGDQVGLFPDPELAAARMRRLLEEHGIAQ